MVEKVRAEWSEKTKEKLLNKCKILEILRVESNNEGKTIHKCIKAACGTRKQTKHSEISRKFLEIQ